jgi:hypothetical protein
MTGFLFYFVVIILAAVIIDVYQEKKDQTNPNHNERK